MSGGRSTSGTETASVASASPYTGSVASRRYPYGLNARSKLAIVSANTGSAPQNAARTHERSSSSNVRSRARRAHASYAELGAAVIVARYRLLNCSQNRIGFLTKFARTVSGLGH